MGLSETTGGPAHEEKSTQLGGTLVNPVTRARLGAALCLPLCSPGLAQRPAAQAAADVLQGRHSRCPHGSLSVTETFAGAPRLYGTDPGHVPSSKPITSKQNGTTTAGSVYVSQTEINGIN